MVFCDSSFQDYHNNEKESQSLYFNRWFSAISQAIITKNGVILVTILILIDGFLQ